MSWITIHKTPNLLEAELIKNTLSGLDIQAVVINKQVSGYPLVGIVEVNVMQQDQAEATSVVAEMLQSNP